MSEMRAKIKHGFISTSVCVPIGMFLWDYLSGDPAGTWFQSSWAVWCTLLITWWCDVRPALKAEGK